MVAEWLRFLRLLYRQSKANRARNWVDIKQLLTNRLVQTRIAPKQTVNPDPPVLLQLASAFWLSQAIYVAAKLGIADLLAVEPRSCNQLALATAVHPPSLERLLRALSTADIVAQVDHGYFALTPFGEGLRTAVPGSLRDTVITLGEIHYEACGKLLYSIQTGCPGFNQAYGASLFGYLGQNTEASQSFNRGMSNLSSMLAYAVLLAYDFSDCSYAVDVGGGEGKLLEKIVEFHPNLNGVVFDSDPVESARRNSRSTRCSHVKGDFFEWVPEGADLYLLCGVIHDWDDEHAFRILRNCRRAMGKHSKLLLVEMVVPSSNSNSFSKLLDLNMLVMNGGRERTKAEFTVLLNVAGYRMTRAIPTLAPQSILEALPA
jgi:O-methyltransferase domain/Dimerisation domain